MVEQRSHYRSYDRSYDPDIDNEDLTDRHAKGYRFGSSNRPGQGISVPLYISDSEGEPDPSEYQHMTPLRRRRRASVSSWMLAGVLAIAAMAVVTAVVFAGFSSDALRDIAISAKAGVAVIPRICFMLSLDVALNPPQATWDGGEPRAIGAQKKQRNTRAQAKSDRNALRPDPIIV